MLPCQMLISTYPNPNLFADPSYIMGYPDSDSDKNSGNDTVFNVRPPPPFFFSLCNSLLRCLIIISLVHFTAAAVGKYWAQAMWYIGVSISNSVGQNKKTGTNWTDRPKSIFIEKWMAIVHVFPFLQICNVEFFSHGNKLYFCVKM